MSADTTAISPYIYGYNDWTRDETTDALCYTFERFGGNSTTAYNWETNYFNCGTDYYNFNGNMVVNTSLSALKDVPGEGVFMIVDHARENDRASLVTLQLAGYVAADSSGIVTEAQTAPSSRWKTVKVTKGSTLLTTPDTTDDYVYLDEEVNMFVEKYGTAANGGILAYEMDNETGLWPSVHPRLHPDAPTCAEIISQNEAVAAMVKSIDSGAYIFGPTSYGWEEFWSYQAASDWTTAMQTTYGWFLSYYLSQMSAASTSAGVRLLDVLDIHYYADVYATNSGGTSVRVGTDDSSTDALISARLQAPRSLWDTTYTESSWITSYRTYGPIELIPRLQASIDSYYPGTKIAISEYNFGGQSHVSGGIAEADTLGIFGANNVFAACYWGDVGGYMTAAFRIYTNYDGNGSKFGDLSVSVSNPDAASFSTYASKDSDTGRLHLIAINKTSSATDATISIANTGRVFASAKVYGFDKADGDDIVAFASVTSISGDSFSYTLPAYGVLHFVLEDPEINGVKISQDSDSSKLDIFFDTDPDTAYELQSSTDMKSWSTVEGMSVAGDGGVFKVVVDTPSVPTFWRAVKAQ